MHVVLKSTNHEGNPIALLIENVALPTAVYRGHYKPVDPLGCAEAQGVPTDQEIQWVPTKNPALEIAAYLLASASGLSQAHEITLTLSKQTGCGLLLDTTERLISLADVLLCGEGDTENYVMPLMLVRAMHDTTSLVPWHQCDGWGVLLNNDALKVGYIDPDLVKPYHVLQDGLGHGHVLRLKQTEAGWQVESTLAVQAYTKTINRPRHTSDAMSEQELKHQLGKIRFLADAGIIYPLAWPELLEIPCVPIAQAQLGQISRGTRTVGMTLDYRFAI